MGMSPYLKSIRRKIGNELLLTPGVQPHRMLLTRGGWWEQRGGLWGASQPGDSSMVLMGWAARIRREGPKLLDLGSK